MKNKCNTTKIIFGIYCLLLIWIVLFKVAFNLDDVRALVSARSINLIPFYYSCTGEFSALRRETLLNVLVFLPFGLYLKMLNKPAGKAILLGFAVSLFFEIVQIALAIGAGDITDLIANTFGTAVGAWAYMLARKVFKTKKKLDRTINVLALIALVLFFAMAALLIVGNM